uniref:BED-type domain-containing protein n=1 Tax=Romanomermis culicivorax TaxID=13658 RepID=A0A915I724_ROMCU
MRGVVNRRFGGKTMPKPLPNPIWDYFRHISSRKVQCTKEGCSICFTWSSTGTSNIRKHLRNQHPELFAEFMQKITLTGRALRARPCGTASLRPNLSLRIEWMTKDSGADDPSADVNMPTMAYDFSVKMNENTVMALIDGVRRHPCLWQTSHLP